MDDSLKDFRVLQVKNGFVVSRAGTMGYAVDNSEMWIATDAEKVGKIIHEQTKPHTSAKK